MLFPWLQVRHTTLTGTLEPALYEHTSLYRAFTDTCQLILSFVGSVEQQLVIPSSSLCEDSHGIWLRRFDEKTVVAEYCMPYEPEQARTRAFDKLCGEVLAPLSSLILLNVDSLGGLESAVKLIVRWMAYSSLVDNLPNPQLIVISKKAFNYTQLQGSITTELLCLLRELHPEHPYSRDEVVQMWNRRVGGIQYICNDNRASIMVHLKAASHVRLSWGLQFSSLNFKDLLQKAVIASWQSNKDFDILQALGVSNPLTTDASRYLSQFLAAVHQQDSLAVASSCLAYRLYSQASHVFHPALAFQSFVKPALLHMAQPQQSIEIIRHHFVSFVVSDGKNITEHHIARMRDEIRVTLCGCNLCLFGTPIHMLSCGHWLCSYCTAVTQELSLDGKCVLCGTENAESFQKQPLPAGIRTLELLGTKPPLRFLHEVRKLLFGHLIEYVDLVVGAESDQLIQRYFSDNCGLPQLSRDMQGKKKTIQRKALKPSTKKTCVLTAIHKGGCWLRNYGPSIPAQRRPPLLRSLSHKQRKAEAIDIEEQVVLECKGLWGAAPQVRIRCEDEVEQSTAAVATKLFSALFYVKLVSRNSHTLSFEIELKCRLSPGSHLSAILYKIREKDLMVSYRAGGRWQCEHLCLPYLNHSKPLTKRFLIKSFTPEATLEVKIDSPIEFGRQEYISNTPCKLWDLIHKKVPGGNMELPDCQTSSIDYKIDSLLDFCTDVWGK